MRIFVVHFIVVKNNKIESIDEELFSILAPFYIAADNEKKTIIVSIRGTLSATDILTDINAIEDVLETELFGNGHCHSGKYN